HQDHAGSPSEGAVIDLPVLPLGPVADVPNRDLDQPPLQRPLEDALAQETLEKTWEQREDIEPERGRGRSHHRFPTRRDLASQIRRSRLDSRTPGRPVQQAAAVPKARRGRASSPPTCSEAPGLSRSAERPPITSSECDSRSAPPAPHAP